MSNKDDVLGPGDSNDGGESEEIETKSVVNEKTAESKTVKLELVPKGLPNLGNTCFLNSVLQCLMSTHQLTSYFESVGKAEELRLSNDCVVVICDERIELEAATFELEPIRMPFVEVFRNFIREFHCCRSPNPRPVFDQIARRTPRFRGYQQQDAHELLRYLLDGLRHEELNRFKKGILNFLGDDLSTNTKRKAQAYLRCISQPTLDRVFAGTLLQRIECCDCGHVSTCFEPFLDLSLPLSKKHTNNVVVNKKNGTSQKEQKKGKKAKKKQQKGKGRKQKWDPVEEVEKLEQNGLCNGDLSPADDPSSAALVLAEVDVEETPTSIMSDEGEPADVEDEQELNRDFARVLSPTPPNDSESSGVLAALNRFTAEETLSASNAYECERCCAPINKNEHCKIKKTVEARKRYLVYSPPAILTLHLKRFEQYHQFNRTYTSKVGGRVDFPLVLDLAPYCVESIRVQKRQTKVLYSLYGVVCHSGGLSSGHYVAYVRSRPPQDHLDSFFRQATTLDASNFGENSEFQRFAKLTSEDSESPALPLPTEKSAQEYLDQISTTSRWYHCSDSAVSLSKLTQVLSAEAYLLFYERVF